MLDDKPTDGPRDKADEPVVDTTPVETGEGEAAEAVSPPFDESIVDEVAALFDDGRTYAEAELTFQKTRAAIAGKSVGVALGLAIVAIILFHIALLALAVGLVIALEPLVTIWGAIAIVVGALLLGTVLLLYGAMKRGQLVGALFGDKGDDA